MSLHKVIVYYCIFLALQLRCEDIGKIMFNFATIWQKLGSYFHYSTCCIQPIRFFGALYFLFWFIYGYLFDCRALTL